MGSSSSGGGGSSSLAFIQFFEVSLHVLHHEIFPCQLIMVGVMIDHPALGRGRP